MSIGVWITLLAFLAYFALIYTAHRTGWLERHKMSLALGIILMWRTQRGKEFLERVSRWARGWRGYGNVSIVIVLFFMFLMLTLLIWQAFIVVRIPPGIIKPQQMLGIPGVNPVIPLWYGIFGLAVAMVVHECAHGILARVGKITVKSLGLLFLVVPIGAFVEPDEEELAKVDRGRRARVFAVGPATNILVGFLVVGIFAWGFMASVEPAEEGVILNYISDREALNESSDQMFQTPASTAGMRPWSTLMSIESKDGRPLGPNGENKSVIRNAQDFLDTMDRTHANQEVELTWYHDGRTYNATVRLWDKGDVYGPEYSGKGYLGASSRLIHEVPAGEFFEALEHPMDYAEGSIGFRNITFFYISLPFTRPSLQPPSAGVIQAFEITGPLAALGDGGFWLIANLLYWVFWLNIMVGIFNALPAIPLDGGYIFRDGLSWVIHKLRPGKDEGEVDGLATKITLGLSLVILLLIIWQFIGPSVGAMAGL